MTPISYKKRDHTMPFSLTQEKIKSYKQRALLLACGMVASSTLMGVILAIPFAWSESTEVLRVVPSSFDPYAISLSVAVTGLLLYWL